MSVKTLTSLRGTAETFELRAELEAKDGERRVFEDQWGDAIRRDLV